MSYTPINVGAYTASFAGAVSGMAVSGWITDPNSIDYASVVAIAGAFAQEFDTVWDNATLLSSLEQAAITAIVQTDFQLRGPGPLNNPTFLDPNNWNVAARACAALVLECDAFFAAGGIIPPLFPTSVPLSDIIYSDGGTIVPLAEQNGSINAPFKTITAGITHVPAGGGLLVTPGNYAAEGAIHVTSNLQILPISDPFTSQIVIDSLVITAVLNLNNTQVNGTTDLGAPIIRTLTANSCGFSGAITGNGIIVARNGCFFGDTIECDFITASDSSFNGNITCSSTVATFANCTFDSAIAITFAAPGTVILDAASLASWNLSGSIVVNGTILTINPEQPLSNVLYVNQGTTIPTGNQNGSIGTPYKLAATALTALAGAGSLLLTPGDYSAEGVLHVTKSVEWLPIADPTTSQLTVAGFNMTSGVNLNLNYTAVTGNIALSTFTLTANSCSIAGNITGTGVVVTYNNTFIGGTIGCSFIQASNSAFNGNITCSGTSAQFTNCTFDSAISITFSGAAGTVTLDSASLASFIAAGVTVINGSFALLQSPNSLTVTNFSNTKSAADLALAADPLQSFPAFTFTGINKLAASKKWAIEMLVEVVIYRDADHGVNGQVDFTIQATITTDGAGTATVTFNTVPVPNISYLPAGLAGASSNIITSANGFTVQAQRPAGVACHARYFVSWERINDVT